MAAPTFKVHVSEFNKYLGDLAHEMKGQTTKDIVKGEAATVLAAAADLTEKGDRAYPSRDLQEVRRAFRPQDQLPDEWRCH